MGRCPLDVSASHYNGQPHRRGSWARRQLWWTFSLTFRSISFMLFFYDISLLLISLFKFGIFSYF